MLGSVRLLKESSFYVHYIGSEGYRVYHRQLCELGGGF